MILKTRTCLLIFIIILHIQLLCFPAGQGLKKGDFSAFRKVDKISNGSEKTSYQNTSFAISFKTTMYSPFIFVKTFTDLLVLWC